MQKAFHKVEQLAETLKEYVNTRIDNVKFEFAEKSSEAIGNMSARIVLAMIFLLFLFFSGIALSFLINIWMESSWLGFLLVSVFYLLLGGFVWFGREKIFRFRLMNSMLDKLCDRDEKNQ